MAISLRDVILFCILKFFYKATISIQCRIVQDKVCMHTVQKHNNIAYSYLMMIVFWIRVHGYVKGA